MKETTSEKPRPFGILLLLAGAGLALAAIWTVGGAIQPSKKPTMDLVAWDDVKEGMTKEEVVRLLGEPVAEVTYVPTADEKKSRWVRRYTNRYQYVAGGGASWTAPLCWDPHPDAYVIRFDKADRVVSWSTPEDRSKESIPGR